jgi:hypothetical protein
MASSTGHPAPVSPETYWKRRVAVLAIVLTVVALIAWACQASSSGNGDAQQAGVDTDPDAQDEEDPPEGGSDDEDDSEDSEDDEDTDDEEDSEDSDGAGGADGNGDGQGGSGGGERDRPTAEPRQASDACRWDDVVTTLALDDDTYASGEEPRITLTLVNLGEQTCTVNVGPDAMQIIIMSGEDRIFSTADCEEGDRNEELEQGRPLILTFDWDRSRSWEDCRDTDRNAGSGTYYAELDAVYGNRAENQPFRLR